MGEENLVTGNKGAVGYRENWGRLKLVRAKWVATGWGWIDILSLDYYCHPNCLNKYFVLFVNGMMICLRMKQWCRWDVYNYKLICD